MREVLFALVLTLAPIASLTQAGAQTCGPTASQLSERRALAHTLKTSLRVHWDAATGAPASVTFRPPLRLPARLRGKPERLARRTLFRLRRLYGIERLGAPGSLVHVDTRRFGPWTVARFTQRVGKLAVDGSDLRVVLTRKRQKWLVMSIAGRVHGGLPRVVPIVPAAPRANSRVVLVRHASRWQPAFAVRNKAGTREDLLDAAGSVLRSRSLVHHGVFRGRVLDTGNGSSLRPLPDLEVTVNGRRVTTDARGRFAGSGASVPGGLRGPHEVVVQSGTAHQARRDRLQYARNDTRTDEVSAFFHLVATRRWLDQYETLLGGVHRARIHAEVRHPANNAFAYHEPNRIGGQQGWRMVLGGIRTKSASRDGSVVSHERAHLLMYAMGFVGEGSQAGGIHEGLSDYLAASRRSDPLVGPGLVDRDLSVLKVWPRDGGEEHKNGWIFGGAVWDARQDLGARAADRLTLAAIPLLHGSATLLEGRDAFLAADRRLHGGRNEEALTKHFLRHGIGERDGAPPQLTVDPTLVMLRPGDATANVTLTATDPDAKGCKILLGTKPFLKVKSHTEAKAGEEARLELEVPNDVAHQGAHQLTVTAIDGDGRETTELLYVVIMDFREVTREKREYQVDVGDTKRIQLRTLLGADLHRKFGARAWLAGNVSTRAHLTGSSLVLRPRAGEEGRHQFTLRASTEALPIVDSLHVEITVHVGSGPVIDVEHGHLRPGQELTLEAGGARDLAVDAFWDRQRLTGIAPTTSTVTLTLRDVRVVPPSDAVKVELKSLMLSTPSDFAAGSLRVETPDSEEPRVITLTLVAARANGKTTTRSLRINVLPTADDPPTLDVSRDTITQDDYPSETTLFARDPEGRGLRVEMEIIPIDSAALAVPTITLTRNTGADPPAGQEPPRIGGSASVMALGNLSATLKVENTDGGRPSGEKVLVARVVLRAVDARGQQSRKTVSIYAYREAAPPQAPPAAQPAQAAPPQPAPKPEPRRGARGALQDALGD